MNNKEKAKILIIDDDESTRRTLSFVLRKKGYEVDTAVTGKEALKKTKEGKDETVCQEIELMKFALKKADPDKKSDQQA